MSSTRNKTSTPPAPPYPSLTSPRRVHLFSAAAPNSRPPGPPVSSGIATGLASTSRVSSASVSSSGMGHISSPPSFSASASASNAASLGSSFPTDSSQANVASVPILAKPDRSRKRKRLRQKRQQNAGRNKSRYFRFSRNSGAVAPTKKRPGNQSNKGVVKKAAEKFRKSVPRKKRRIVSQEFLDSYDAGKPLSEMNGGRGIDMAHAVSAQRLANALAQSLQSETNVQAAIAFSDSFVSSDEEDDDRDQRHENIRTAHDSNSQERGAAADAMLSRHNRSSRNLLGAASSTNRGIGGRDDPHSTSDGYTLPYMRDRFRAMARFEKSVGVTTATNFGEINEREKKINYF